MFAGAFSLSDVSDKLEEYERVIFDKSEAKEMSGKNAPAVKYGEKSKTSQLVHEQTTILTHNQLIMNSMT